MDFLGPKLGKDKCQMAIVNRDIYELKSAGAAFRSDLSDCMKYLGNVHNKTNHKIWVKVCTKEKYYFYMLEYLDDKMSVHDCPDSFMIKFDKFFHSKPMQ